MKHIKIPPLRWYAPFLDAMMRPIMYLLSGTFLESPQETHKWNKYSLRDVEVRCLSLPHMLFCGKIAASKRWRYGIPVFHMPILGGWRRYVVLTPANPDVKEWYVGWIAEDAQAVSRLLLNGSVRLLRGDVDARFFGLDTDGNQISVKTIGTGSIGDGGPFSRTPLR